MIKDNNTKWGKHRGQFHKKIVDLIMIFSRSLFFVDHIQKSFLTKPTHTIPCTTSSSESEETSSQSSKNKRREKVFMATGFPSTSIFYLSVSSGERLASNRSLFANKWTIVALFWNTRNPRHNLLAIGLSLQFPSISKQKKVASIFYTFLRVYGIRMNMILTWLPYPGLPSYSVKNLSCWLSFLLHSLIFSCTPTRRHCQLCQGAEASRWRALQVLVLLFPFPKKSGTPWWYDWAS